MRAVAIMEKRRWEAQDDEPKLLVYVLAGGNAAELSQSLLCSISLPYLVP